MLNYSTHAISDLMKLAKMMKTVKHPDVEGVLDFIDCVRASPKFVVPDKGSLIYDAGDIPHGLEMTRLPFRTTVVEVPFDQTGVSGENIIQSTRRLILAQEIIWDDQKRDYKHISEHDEPNAVRIDVACWIDKSRSWILQPVGAIVMIGESTKSARWKEGDPYKDNRLGDTAFTMRSCPRLDESTDKLLRQMGEEAFMHMVSNDNGTEVRIVAEMLLAMSCRNVDTTIERPPEKMAKARLKSGNEPFYDTHVLMVGGAVMGSTSSNETADGGFKVRQHLRRGHVRNLANGERVWVNQTIVAAGSPLGATDKTYRLKT